MQYNAIHILHNLGDILDHILEIVEGDIGNGAHRMSSAQ